MIDWISARVPLDWQAPINSGSVVCVRSDGTVDWQVDRRRMVEGSFQSHFSVRSVERGFVEVSGNPAKFLQGHNLFGSDDVRGLLHRVMELLCSSLGITPCEADVRSWLRGEALISRIDLTFMYELPCREDVRQWLQAAGKTASVKWRGRGHFADGTLTFGRVPKGKRASQWQAVLYCKGDEIAVPGRGLHPDLPQRDRLVDWAGNKLRIELRFRTGELKRIGLRQVGEWTPSHVSSVFETYLAKIDVAEEQIMAIVMEEGLKPRHRSAYALWKTGADLRAIYPRNTFYRYRKEIIDLCGIDIGTRAVVDNVVPLRRVLQARPSSVPTWAGSLCYEPGPLLRAV